MAEQRYYYLKLKENFFDTDEMKILESMDNGYLYSNILLKMYLKALKNDGKLTFNDFIPYDVKMLSTITGHNIDIVDKALRIFKSMRLIDVLDNGAIYLLDMQKMIGSISNEGIRKAEYREKIEKESNGTNLGQSPNIISISNSNSKSISNSKLKDVKHIYGEYKHILLTDKEFDKLKIDFGEQKTKDAITLLDESIEMKGYKYKSHNLAIRKWVIGALKEKDTNNKQEKSIINDVKRMSKFM
jgi:predicted phage replisome organizer